MEVLIDRIPMLAVLLGLMLCSAFFSATETALFSLSREDLRRYERATRGSGKHITLLMNDTPTFLAAILFGNMIVNVSIFTLSVLISLAYAAKDQHGAAAMTGIVSLLAVIIFGEVSPKGIAVGRPQKIAQFLATPAYYFYRSVRPVALVLRRIAEGFTNYLSKHFAAAPYVTRDELKAVAAMAEQQGALDTSTRGMIEQVVELADLRAKHIMTPRVDVVMFHLAQGRQEFCDMARRRRLERVVVYDRVPDNVVGVLFTRDVFVFPQADLRDLLMPVRYVAETQKVDRLVQQLSRERDSVAIVVDEYGGMSGLVTLQHVLHEVIGEIREGTGVKDPPVKMLDEDTYSLSGALNTRDWPEVMTGSMQRVGVETVGGIVMSIFGRVPKEGEMVEWQGLRFTIEKMTGHRIVRVRVQRIREEEGP